MICDVRIQHVGRDSVDSLIRELSRVFGAEACPASELPSISNWFEDAQIVAERSLFAGRSVNGTAYAFFKLDRSTTQLFIESSTGPETLSEFKRVITNAVVAISRSQRFPWTCNLSHSYFYEMNSDRTLGLAARLDTLRSRIQGLATKFNLLVLVLTYAVAVGVTGFFWPNGSPFSIGKLLIQPSLYAPAAVIIYVLLGVFRRPLREVIIYERN